MNRTPESAAKNTFVCQAQEQIPELAELAFILFLSLSPLTYHCINITCCAQLQQRKMCLLAAENRLYETICAS